MEIWFVSRFLLVQIMKQTNKKISPYLNLVMVLYEVGSRQDGRCKRSFMKRIFIKALVGLRETNKDGEAKRVGAQPQWGSHHSSGLNNQRGGGCFWSYQNPVRAIAEGRAT